MTAGFPNRKLYCHITTVHSQFSDSQSTPVMRIDLVSLLPVHPVQVFRSLILAVTLSILVVGLVVGCSGANQSGNSSEMMEVNEVIEMLRAEGLSVTPGRSLSTEFGRDGLSLKTDKGETLRVYEFQSSGAASMELSRKNPSAGSAPFYYQKGNIVVEHAGNDSETERVLRSVFEPKRR